MQLHVGYLRSLEESERVRAACLSYLQRWLKYFVRQRPDIVNKLEHLAADLGGRLTNTRKKWKNSCIDSIISYSMARRTRSCLPRVKCLIIRTCDKQLFSMVIRSIPITSSNTRRSS